MALKLSHASYLLSSVGLLATTASAAPNVVASIAPVHSIVAAVMKNVGEPELLIDKTASPHGLTLRPSQVRALSSADAVFWIGEALELPLANYLEGQAASVEIMDMHGLSLLQAREDHGDHDDYSDHAEESHDDHGEEHEHAHTEEHPEDHEDEHGHSDDHDGHDHDEHGHDEHGHEEHNHGMIDPHVWLSPSNAIVVAHEVAHHLSEVDPENAATYEENADVFAATLATQMEEIQGQLDNAPNTTRISCHDAYQYFETEFGLDIDGVITQSPEVAPGAQHVQELVALASASEAVCLLAEPQFDSTRYQALFGGVKVELGTIDPLGATLESSPTLYFELLDNMAASLADCASAF